MNVLIAEDDAPSLLMLQSMLNKWGYAVTTAVDGNEAWKILCEPEHPRLLVLDWIMPGLQGPEIVRRLRERQSDEPYFAIIITSGGFQNSAARALDGGADDFIRKPFDTDELRARIAVGHRMISLQKSLSDNIRDLQQTLSRVKQLEGIIPICMYCKKIRDDQDTWNQLEQYISQHSGAMFSHGICPICAEEQIEKLKNLKHN